MTLSLFGNGKLCTITETDGRQAASPADGDENKDENGKRPQPHSRFRLRLRYYLSLYEFEILAQIVGLVAKAFLDAHQLVILADAVGAAG